MARSPARKAASKQPVCDLGTPEYRQRRQTRLDFTGRGRAVRLRALDVTELDRLFHVDLISQAQLSAGESLMRDLWQAKYTGPGAINWNASRVGDPSPISETQDRAIRKIKSAMQWVQRECGQRVRLLLFSVAAFSHTVSSAEHLADLRAGLDAMLSFSDWWRKGAAPRAARPIQYLDRLTITS